MINFTYLKYFYDAATHGSMSFAARENSVSQSAISQGIAKLEASLRVDLITHQKQKFTLTEEGQVVFKESTKLFAAAAGLKDKLSELKGEISGEIKFACTNSIAQFFLPARYLKMKEQFPKVSLKFHRGSLNYIHDLLHKEKVNFALVLETPEFEGYDQKPIAQGTFRLYKHKSLKNSEGIIVDHLENYEVKELLARHKYRYGKELHIKDTLSGWALVLTFVMLGHGVGFLPDFIGRDNKDLKEVKLDISPIQYYINMIKLKGAPISRAEKAFLDILCG